MDPHTQALHVYRELADRFAERGDAAMRDRFLILAADAALAAGLPDEAEWLRHRLLQGSRHHMLKGYPSFMAAANAADVQTWIRDLRQKYPLEAAIRMLNMLRAGEVVAPEEFAGAAPEPAEDPEWSRPSKRPAIPPTADDIDLGGSGLPAPPVTRRPPAQRENDQLLPFLDDDTPGSKRPTPASPAPHESQPAASPRPAPARAAAPRPRGQPRPSFPADQEPPRAAPARPAVPQPPPPPPVPPATRPWPQQPVRPALPPEEEPASLLQGGAWLGATLGVLTFLVGLAWWAFVVLRPILPPQLFR
jgi:hypothetical protein